MKAISDCRCYFWWSTDLDHIQIQTKWFILYLSNGARSLNRYGFWWGFKFWWVPNPRARSDGFWFLREIGSESDFVSVRQTK